MNEVLFKIGSRSFSFTSIKVLFLTFITCMFLFIKFVVEAMKRLRISFLTQVTNRVFFVLFIFGTWNLTKLFWVSKITFSSISHCYLMEIIPFHFSVQQTIINCFILMRNLLLYFSYTCRKCKSSLSSNRKYLVPIISIWIWRVFCARWRWTCLKIYKSFREPWEFCSWFKRPIGLISSCSFNYFLTCHFR